MNAQQTKLCVGVTGANGFVGKHLLAELSAVGLQAVPLVPTPYGLPNEEVVGAIETASYRGKP